MSVLVVAHLAATWFMCGLIVFVHVVHYRLFEAVGEERFADYEERHTRLTGMVVGPPMLIELATAIGLVLWGDPTWPAPWPLVGLGLLGLIWGLTALVAVPTHGALARGFSPSLHRRLMRMNAARSILWILRAGLASAMLI